MSTLILFILLLLLIVIFKLRYSLNYETFIDSSSSLKFYDSILFDGSNGGDGSGSLDKDLYYLQII